MYVKKISLIDGGHEEHRHDLYDIEELMHDDDDNPDCPYCRRPLGPTGTLIALEGARQTLFELFECPKCKVKVWVGSTMTI